MTLSPQGQKPWWMTRQFFVRERLLFGRWDGVFTSCLVNLLGVIVFLRAGWVVGEAGVVMATVIVLVAGQYIDGGVALLLEESS